MDDHSRSKNNDVKKKILIMMSNRNNVIVTNDSHGNENQGKNSIKQDSVTKADKKRNSIKNII